MNIMNMNIEDSRKNMVLKARVQEVKHHLHGLLQKDKKHQWYIYKKKNHPYSKDNINQVTLEKEIDPDVTSKLPLTQKISSIPLTSLIVSSVGIAAGVLLIKNHT
ncbi:MAG: hypothetical protein WB421_13960 [Terriglobales bacterium]